MSNQKAPSRPWFSFSSLTRLSPNPAPAPAPQPRPSLARPTLRPAPQLQEPTPPAPPRNAVAPQATQSARPRAPAPAPASGAATAQVPKEPVRTAPNASRGAYVPSVPIPRTNAPPTASYPNSIEQKPQPSKKVSAPAATTTASYATAMKEGSSRAAPAANITTTAMMARSVSPTSSQEFVKPAASNRLSQNPKIMAVSEDKKVISQRTVDKPKAQNNSETNKSPGDLDEKQELPKSKEMKENAKGYGMKHSGLEDVDHGMRVLTIAGENKGAVMVVHPSKKHGYGGHSNFLYNNKNDINNDGSESESSNNGRSNDYGSSYSKDKKSNKANKMRPLPMRAFMNSNVQGINNSVVSNTSFNHHDPGIHLGLTKKPSNDGFHIKGGSFKS